MTIRSRGQPRPSIVVTSEDHSRLRRIAEGGINTMPDLSAELSLELDRARILLEGRTSPRHVRIGSRVRFRDETTRKESDVQVVWPEDADIATGKISVVTPIGVALIGMEVTRSIEWVTRSGEVKRLTVVQVGSPADTPPSRASVDNANAANTAYPA